MDKKVCVNLKKWSVLAAFIIMIVVNILANALPINGVRTGEVSANYSNLFTPASYAFIIWSVIYVLLGGYTLYQLGLFQYSKSLVQPKVLNNIGFYFIISCLSNSLWLVAWHYNRIILSVGIMIVLLVSLIIIALDIKKSKLSFRDILFIKLPFSIYFGWITVATIANITAMLVAIGWNGFGISDATWTIIILIIGAIIGIITTIYLKNCPYTFSIIWAYIAIIVNHCSKNGFNKAYPGIIWTSSICLALLLASVIYVFITKKKKGDFVIKE